MKQVILLIACWLATASVAAAQTPLSTLIDRALREGSEATLPAPLSKSLGVSRGKRPMPARQLQRRTGHTLHTFSVDPGHRHEIVLAVLDEQANRTTGYLMTPAGRLRKVITYEDGQVPVTVPRAHAQDEFLTERDAWMQTAAQH